MNSSPRVRVLWETMMLLLFSLGEDRKLTMNGGFNNNEHEKMMPGLEMRWKTWH